MVIGLAVIAIPLLVLFCSPRWQSEALPSPNGYDDLEKIAASVASNPGDWRTQNVEQLRAALAPNSNALTVIRGALKKEWAVPISPGTNSMNVMMQNIMATKMLAKLVCAEGRLAELEGRTNEALKELVTCIELGDKSSRHGLMVHELVGIACKAIGNRAMQNSWPLANDATLAHALDCLAEIDGHSGGAEEAIQRDRNWARNSSGLVRYAWMSLMTKSTTRDAAEYFHTKRLRSEAEMRLLRTDIAIELFRRKNARIPAALDELVPQFLDAVPVDPFGGKAFVYRQRTNSYLLYSIGPDKKDDGGTPLTTSRRASIQNPIFFEIEPDTGDIVSKPPLRR